MRGYRHKSLRYLELAAWTLGTLLVATYAGAQWWYAHGRAEGIAAFDVARDAALRSPPASVAGAYLSVGRVDMSTWSLKRVESYRESARAGSPAQRRSASPAISASLPIGTASFAC